MDRRWEDEPTRTRRRRRGEAGARDERPYLVGVAGEHAGSCVPLTGVRQIVFGRKRTCDIRFPIDLDVSREHAKLTMDETGILSVEDLGSKNGTSVNDRDVKEPVLLRRGDRIVLNESTVFKVDWLSEDEWALWRSAVVDALTDCYNRKAFDVRFPETFSLALRRGAALSFLLLDVDHFKRVNDAHGFEIGDVVLRKVAAAIRQRVEPVTREGQAFRWGGEEFCVLLPGIAGEKALAVAEGVRAAVEALEIEVTGSRLPVTISGGMVSLDAGGLATHEDFFRAANARLRAAKDGGRNRVVG